MSIIEKSAPGPYRTVDVGGDTNFHTYVIDANGRKIAAVWGPIEQKVWTAAVLAASWEIIKAAKAVLENSGPDLPPSLGDMDALRAAVAKAEGDQP